MRDVPDAYRILRQGIAKRGGVDIPQPRRGIGERDAMAGLPVLRQRRRREHQDEQGKSNHRPSSLSRGRVTHFSYGHAGLLGPVRQAGSVSLEAVCIFEHAMECRRNADERTRFGCQKPASA